MTEDSTPSSSQRKSTRFRPIRPKPAKEFNVQGDDYDDQKEDELALDHGGPGKGIDEEEEEEEELEMLERSDSESPTPSDFRAILNDSTIEVRPRLNHCVLPFVVTLYARADEI